MTAARDAVVAARPSRAAERGNRATQSGHCRTFAIESQNSLLRDEMEIKILHLKMI